MIKRLALLSFLFLGINTYAEDRNFINKSPEEGLREALEYYDIKYPDIVYAQAILETGNFKSKICKRKNNLFGLRKGKRYVKYNHWVDSVIAYKNKIQNRYKEGEDYYKFLKRIKYAENPKYIIILKKIVNQENYKTKENCL